jgi:NAD(P)-dependent dehydrogenase (short-subunit alcohol dehydrogenase family)
MTSHNIELKAAPKKIQGKIALITGDGKRLGRAIAIALAAEGVHIVAHDHRDRESETLKVCDEVVGCGVRSWNISADLEKPEEYESLIARSIKIAGPLDILINNASIFLPNTLMNVGFSDMIRHFHVNAWAPLVLSREFARLAGNGKIINLLDTKIIGYDTAHVAYILSKQQLFFLTKLCALEFAPAITVNGVAPGLILPPDGKDERYFDQLAQSLPLKRHGGPDDISEAILSLLKSNFVTGQILFVDGGGHLLEEPHGPHLD